MDRSKSSAAAAKRGARRIWDRLLEGGGKPQQCGWLKDKFGFPWQVVPANIGDLMKDPKKGDRVMKEVLKMVKIDIAALERAAEGK